MSAHESVESPIPQTDGSILRKFIVTGTIDDAQAEAEAFAAASPIYRTRIRQPLPSVRQLGRGSWEFEFSYIPFGVDPLSDPVGDLPTIGSIEIDGSGGTQHITQAREQAVYGATNDQIAIANALTFYRPIGFHKDGVSGVDIDVPGTTYKLTKRWLTQTVSGDYLYALSQLRGKINYYFWTLRWAVGNQAYQITFEPAELRFLGFTASISATADGLSAWDITYTLHHSQNEYNLYVGGGITVPFKGGQHYLWHLYRKLEVAGGFIEVPDVTCQARVYEWADFGLYLGF